MTTSDAATMPNEAATPAANETINPPRLVTAYAYSPRQGAAHHNSDHLMTLDPIKFGRLVRKPNEALCRRDHWGLMPPAVDRPADCPKCLAIAARINATFTTEAK